jgi:hypothetical protein
MIFIKKCLLFTAGSVCRVKRFTTEWQMFYWWRRGWNGGAKVAETTVKIFLCCGFWRADKAMGQVYQCWWRICREINLLSRFEYHTFYVLYPFVTCWLSLVPVAQMLLTGRPGNRGSIAGRGARDISLLYSVQKLWGQLTFQDLLLGDISCTTTSGVRHVGIF